jgi:hypothetical protein
MFEEQSESSSEEMSQDASREGDTGSQESGDNYVEPRPEDYGVALGTSACLDQCWADFIRCSNNSRNSAACLGDWQTCIRACAERADAGAQRSEE